MARPVVMQPAGGGSAAGILLLLVAVAGLLALFTGNLERVVSSIAGPAGGAAGLYARGRARGGSFGEAGAIAPGAFGEPTPIASARTPVPQ